MLKVIRNGIGGIVGMFTGTDLVVTTVTIVNITVRVVIVVTCSYVATIIVVIVKVVDFKSVLE